MKVNYRFIIEDFFESYDDFQRGGKADSTKFRISVFPVDEDAYISLGFDDNCVYIQSPGVEKVLNHIGITGEDEDNSFTYYIDDAQYKTKKQLTDYLKSCGWIEDKTLACFI